MSLLRASDLLLFVSITELAQAIVLHQEASVAHLETNGYGSCTNKDRPATLAFPKLVKCHPVKDARFMKMFWDYPIEVP